MYNMNIMEGCRVFQKKGRTTLTPATIHLNDYTSNPQQDALNNGQMSLLSQSTELHEVS